MRLSLVAVCLLAFALVVSSSFAQNVPTPTGQNICDDPQARGTAAYNAHCGACYPRCGNAGNSNNDNGAAQRAQEAAAAAQRQRDAELEQQRIDAKNKHRMEEAEKEAKFNQDKQEALGQLKGISNEGSNSASGLKGLGSTDSALKDAPNIGDSTGLKTLPDVNTDPQWLMRAMCPPACQNRSQPKSPTLLLATVFVKDSKRFKNTTGRSRGRGFRTRSITTPAMQAFSV